MRERFKRRVKIMNRFIILLVIIVNLSHCSTLLTKRDYSLSKKSLKEWDIEGAIERFPDGESGGFITTMEKTYLKLLSGNPDIDELIDYSHRIDNQVRVKATRELKSFFYIETPEGYYASEHEIIWMHLLLSWGYSMRGQPDKARVEAKICANLTGREWSEEGKFDDPLIRVMLAAIWAMCGEWVEAQVDFRAAYRIEPSLKWAKTLSGMNRPPADLIIVLGGTGREPEWNPDLKANPFRGFRGIEFRPQGVKSSLVLRDSDNRNFPLEITPDSSYWYKRHFIRNNEMHDIIEDSTYAQKATAGALRGTAVTLAGITTGILVAAGGLALGGGIIVLGLYVESIELASLGLIPIVGGATWGYDIAGDSYRYSVRQSKRDLDVSRTYRFVRFLPEYAWVGWSRNRLKAPVTVFNKGKPVITSKDSDITIKVNIVSIGFYPDTLKTQIPEKARKSMGRSASGMGE